MGINEPVVGIDPGKKGSAARLDPMAEPLKRLTFYKMPLNKLGDWCEWEMANLVRHWRLSGVERVVLEQCHAFPGPQAYSSAVVMEAYGMWRATLAHYFTKDQIHLVPAGVWKKAMDVEFPIVKKGKKATQKEKDYAYAMRKEKALKRARVEFGLPFVTPLGRQMDGEAEAALIALYGQGLVQEEA